MNVLVGSLNPVKIGAARTVFRRFFPAAAVNGIGVDSQVPHQPQNEAETFAGARNRARAAQTYAAAQGIVADYFVGIEGGLVEMCGRWFVFGAIGILDGRQRISYGSSPHFEVPSCLLPRLRQGEELGHLVDALTGGSNTKQHGGAIGFFTRGQMGREDFYVGGVLCALVPFLNEAVYFPPESP
ncbi:MAG: inosine/xanthosine triphosphatase [Candidatus Omnitrophica bacterium]|nr:inosine/xanthosine triphosphatase [Candidatus Omnitrophota bacterium]